MRPALLALIAAAAGGAGASAAIAVAAASPARPASAAAGAARVQGRFRAAGRVTAVEHLSGVRRGERVSHTWTLSSEGCSASSCTKLRLQAPLELNSTAFDRVTLSRVGAGQYRWRRKVASGALCRIRHISGSYRLAFALNLTVSQRAEVNGVWYATALTATWSASSSGCGTTATRSAAAYTATVTSGVPVSTAPTATTTTGSSTTNSTAPTTTAETMTTFPSSTGTAPIVSTISSTPSPTIPTTTVPRGPQPQAGM